MRRGRNVPRATHQHASEPGHTYTEGENNFHYSDAKVIQDVRDVGGGKLLATVRGPEGNVIGLIQLPQR